MKLAALPIVISLLAVFSAPGNSSAAGSPPRITLQECLQIALEHNPDLRKASTQFLDAQGRVIKLHAILYPTLSTQVLSTPTTIYVQLQEAIYTHATAPQLELSRLTEDQAHVNFSQVLSNVVFQVRQAFTTAMGAQDQAAMLHEFADRENTATTSAQQLYDAGKIEKNFVLSVQVKNNLARQRRDAADLEATQSLLALDNLLGQELPQNCRLLGDYTKDAPANLDVNDLTAQALRDRPDLKLLELVRLSSEQQIQIDQKSAYPLVGFSSDSAIQPPAFGPTGQFDLERNYNEPNVQRVQGNTQLPLSLYATWQIFDGGKLEGIKISDQAQLATREEALTALQRSIPGEIAGAIDTIRAERQNLEMMQTDAKAEELRHSADLDYNAGNIRQIDKVDLEDSLLFQRQAELAAKIRLSLATAALDHALGRGLQTSSPPASTH